MQLRDGGWTYITPSGDVFLWGNGSSADQHLATLDESYFSSPRKLYFAKHPRGDAWSAFELDQKFNLSYTGDFYEDYLGLNERWLLGRDASWYYILPDGRVYRWSSPDELVAVLSEYYYADPSRLYDAQPHGSVEQIARELDQQLDLGSSGSYYVDFLGLGEKWLTTGDGGWVYIKPDGNLLRWNPAGSDQWLASLKPAYHTDPSLLFEAPIPTAKSQAAVSIVGNELLVDWVDGFVGELRIAVSVDSGARQIDHVVTIRVE